MTPYESSVDRMATSLLDWAESTLIPAIDPTKLKPFTFEADTWSVRIDPSIQAVDGVIGNVKLPEIRKRWKSIKAEAEADEEARSGD